MADPVLTLPPLPDNITLPKLPPLPGEPTAKDLGPDVESKIAIARHFGSLGLSPSLAYEATDQISQALYDKTMDPPSLWQRLSNTVKAIPITREIAKLNAQRFMGDESVAARIDTLKAQMPDPKQQIAEFPRQIVSTFADMGYQVKAGLEGVISHNVAYSVGNTLLGPVGGIAAAGAKDVIESTIGSQYGAMVDAGVKPTVARGVAIGMTAVTSALNLVKVEQLPGVRQGEGLLQSALARAVAKIGLSCKLAAFVTGEIPQGIIGAANGAANILGTELAKELSGIPAFTKDVREGIMRQLGISAGVGVVAGAPFVAAGLGTSGLVHDQIQEHVSRLGLPPGAPSILDAFKMSPTEAAPMLREGEPVSRGDRAFIFEGDTQHDTESFITDTVARIKDAYTTKKDMAVGVSPGLRTSIGRLWGRFRGAANSLSSSYDFNGELVFGGKDNPTYRVVSGIPTQRQTEVRPYARELAKPVMQDSLAARGIADPGKMANHAMAEFTETDPQLGKVTLTRGEVMSAWMDFQNEDNRASRLSGTFIEREANPAVRKISAETWQKFFTHLSPEDLADLQKTNETLADLGPKLQEAKQRMHGKEMPVLEHYWPKYVYRGDIPPAEEIANIQEARQFIPINPDESRLIERENVIAPLYLRNFYQVYPELLHESALILKMGEPLQQAGKVLFDPRVSRKIDAKWGRAMRRHLQENLSLMAGRYQTPQAWVNAIDALRTFTITMDLSGNVKTAIKQAMLGARSLPYVRSDGWLNALLQSTFRPARTRQIADSISNIYRESRKTGGTIELRTLLKENASLNKSPVLRNVIDVRQKLQRGGIALTRAMSNWSFKLDAISALNGTEIEIRNVQNGGKLSEDFRAATGLTEEQAKTLTPEERMKAAGRFADYIIGETHATALSSQRAGIMQNAAGRLWSTFKAEPIKAAEAWRRSIMQAHRNPTAANVKKAVKTSLFYGIAEPIAFFMLDYGWAEAMRRDHKPSFLASVALTLSNYALGVGDFTRGIIDRLEYGLFATHAGLNISGQAVGVSADAIYSALKMAQAAGEGDDTAQEKARAQFWDAMATLGLTSMDIPYQFPRAVIQGIHRWVPEVPGSAQDIKDAVTGE